MPRHLRPSIQPKPLLWQQRKSRRQSHRAREAIKLQPVRESRAKVAAQAQLRSILLESWKSMTVRIVAKQYPASSPLKQNAASVLSREVFIIRQTQTLPRHRAMPKLHRISGSCICLSLATASLRSSQQWACSKLVFQKRVQLVPTTLPVTATGQDLIEFGATWTWRRRLVLMF